MSSGGNVLICTLIWMTGSDHSSPHTSVFIGMTGREPTLSSKWSKSNKLKIFFPDRSHGGHGVRGGVRDAAGATQEVN